MTCRTYTKEGTVFHGLYIALLTVCGLLAVYSAGFSIPRIRCSEDAIAAAFTVLIALLVLSVDFFECRAIGARLYMNEDGIGVCRFGKTKVFIRWSEIREIGTGNIPTPFGSKKRVYFCNRKLDEAEKSDLVVLKYHTVHFSYIPKEWYPIMCERLPIPLPQEVQASYVR